jgi:hypothetical protein
MTEIETAENMNVLVFQSEDAFEITLQRLPETCSVDDTLEVTLPVFAAGFPQQTAEMHMYLSIEQAEYLSAQLQACLVTARARTRDI